MTRISARLPRFVALAGVSLLSVTAAMAGDVSVWMWDPNFNGNAMRLAAERYEAINPEANIIIDDSSLQDDIGKALGRAGQQLRLQPQADVILQGTVVDDDIGFRIDRFVALSGQPHGIAVEIRIPHPDRDVTCSGSGDRQQAYAGQGDKARQPRRNAGHGSPPFSFALPPSAT